jgi:high-affinity iron transporter
MESFLIKMIIVIFREFMEISLLVSIILAATTQVKSSRICIIIGIVLGFVGASIIAFFTRFISNALDGMGQEVFDAVILLVTAALLLWTICWMQGHKNIKQQLKSDSNEIYSTLAYRLSLISIVATTMFREGTEIVLFMYSIITSSSVKIVDYLTALTIAAASGLLFGVLIYRGLLRFAQKQIFTISSILLSMIAASFVAGSLKLLISCGVIDVLTEPIWDIGWLISEYSVIGTILKIFIGYNANMSIMELLGYCGFLLLVVFLVQRTKSQQKKLIMLTMNKVAN